MRKTYFTGFLILITCVCCSRFLDKEPTNEIPEEKAYLRFSDIETGLNGCYKCMLAVGYYGKNFILYPEIASDNMKINLARTTGSFQSVYLFTLGAASAEPKDLWNAGYEVIHCANQIIKALPGITDGTGDQRSSALGEALAIRALAHFDMVRAFAQPYDFTPDASHPGVPVMTENTTTLFPSRNTVAEVYTQVLNDLSRAEEIISSGGRNAPFTFSRTAVQALMARVFLYKKDWENAAKYAVLVIQAKGDTLLSRELFPVMWATEYEDKEDLLVLGFTSFDYLTTRSLGYQLLENGYGDIVATNDLYASMDENDIRKKLISHVNGVNYCLKYPGRNYTIGLDNIRVLRLSEMYLIAAEAMSEITGKEDSARYYLNKLRRARIEKVAGVTATGDSLKTLIMEERRRELAFEGHRLFDLLRRKQGVVRTDVLPGSPSTKPYGDDRLIMPIPQRELDANKNMTQNPGY